MNTITQLPGHLPTLHALTLAWAAIAHAPLAAAQAQRPPGAGEALQQLPASPTPMPPGALRLDLGASTTPGGPASTAAVPVKRLRISGNRALDTATLQALVAHAEGTTQTLDGLQALADRLTQHYRAQGHVLARAYVPAQTVRDGEVEIAVLEARYGRIDLDNRSGVGTTRLRALLTPLQAGEAVLEDGLERALLLSNDLAGVTVSATARPGAGVGTSDLVVLAEQSARHAGQLGVDNQGGEATGRHRARAGLSWRNPTGLGDSLDAFVLTSGSRLAYGRLAYQTGPNGWGLNAGLNLSQLNYELGAPFQALQASGHARLFGATLQQAWVRRLRTQVSTELAVEHKRLHDRVGQTDSRNRRHLDQATLLLAVQHADASAMPGQTRLELGYAAGRVGFDDGAAATADAGGARTAGGFGRWWWALSRQQPLPGLAGTVLHASLRGQAASRNLDSAEHFNLGGPTGVRGYRAGDASGSAGWLASLELRQALGGGPWGSWQARVLLDAGHVQLMHTPVSAASPNRVALRSIGLGLDWSGPRAWSAQLVIARPTGAAPAIELPRETQAWAAVTKGF